MLRGPIVATGLASLDEVMATQLPQPSRPAHRHVFRGPRAASKATAGGHGGWRGPAGAPETPPGAHELPNTTQLGALPALQGATAATLRARGQRLEGSAGGHRELWQRKEAMAEGGGQPEG